MPSLMVNSLSKNESDRNPEDIKRSLDDVVHKLEQTSDSSESWSDSVSANRESWCELKEKIRERQRALKQLVMEKKAGLVGPDEFNNRYRKIQDELTELEFRVYNMRLGTKIQK
ncbi:MAG: hypothetical protein EAX81_02225 [Candidatus Thorarchaeota archaeon]|nr:hypothetical protein [Candidatus Thorarchaeota archaeon]